MHNLRLLTISSLDCCNNDDLKLCPLAFEHQLFLTDTKGLYSCQLRPSDGEPLDVLLLLTWKDCDVSTSAILSCDVVDTNVCVTTSEGDVLLYSTEDREVEVAGTVDDGIACACWSPDQELLVVVTKQHQVMVLSSQFLPVGDFNLQESGFGEAPFIELGWGKKETQFHGSEGKHAAKAGTGQPMPSRLSKHDDEQPRISWRGDGQMFVISYVDVVTNSRRLRIANRAGVLQCTSEPVHMLEQSLCWKPSGSLITSAQSLPNKYNIVFFEKNGLRHGEFTLPQRENCFVKEVMWNSDSSVMMVWLQPTIPEEKKDEACSKGNEVHYVQVWTVNNYMWYLKDEMTIPNVQSVLWDTLQAMTLYVLSKSRISTYSFSFGVDRSTGLSEKDLALVTVVKGNRLLMTPFKKTKIPPPMSAYEISFPDQIHCVVFPALSSTDLRTSSSSNVARLCGDSNSVCVLHGNCLTFLTPVDALEDLDNVGCKVDYRLGRAPTFKITYPVHKPVLQFDLSEVDKKLFVNFRLSNCVWMGDLFFTVHYDLDTCEESVLFIDLSGVDAQVNKITVAHGPFLRAVGYCGIVFLQNTSGEVYQLKHDEPALIPALDALGSPVVFGAPCLQMECTSINGNTAILGLSARHRLYYGSKQLSGNCSSFHIHNDHLLFTTTNHLLLMVPLDHTAITSVAQGDFSACGERNVERGSKLVTAVSRDSEVVLQMPRGNIETVVPRQLLVHILQRLLENGSYNTSLELMRKHRVDMNLVFDHHPQLFLDRCSQFVQSVNNPGWVDLFLASLKNEDTTQTLYAFNYKNWLRPKFSEDDACGVSKVDRVCIAMRKAMVAIDEDKYLLPVLTSYVKMDDTQMDEALKKVKDIKDKKLTNLKITAEEGLRHLLYIADANVLCDVALGTYDFDLVMMVFEKSQKDPKEFLPFLNNLKQMEESYMKYSINVYLKRYRRAFESIKNTGSDHLEECLTLIKKDKIFSIALEEFIPGTPLYKAVAESYGDYNLGRGYYCEAALLYERAGKHQDALDAYKQLGNWRRVFILASKMQYSREQMSDLYETTIEVLKEKKMHAEAAIIYKNYMRNEEEAVACLSLAHCWDDAICIAYQHNRPDLIETNVIPELMLHSTYLQKNVDELCDTLTSRCARLVVVRGNMSKEQTDLLEGVGEAPMDADLYSDASTVTGASHSRGSRSHTGTSASGRTYRSAKNRKKLERKKHSTKEGSTFEDIGLVTELHALIVQADELAEPVGSIVSTLYSFGKDDIAVALQTSLHNLLRLIEMKEKVIWPVEEAGAPDENTNVMSRAQMSTAEMLRALQGDGQESAGRGGVLLHLRMKELEPSLRHPPKPTRPSSWALGFLHKKKSS